MQVRLNQNDPPESGTVGLKTFDFLPVLPDDRYRQTEPGRGQSNAAGSVNGNFGKAGIRRVLFVSD